MYAGFHSQLCIEISFCWSRINSLRHYIFLAASAPLSLFTSIINRLKNISKKYTTFARHNGGGDGWASRWDKGPIRRFQASRFYKKAPGWDSNTEQIPCEEFVTFADIYSTVRPHKLSLRLPSNDWFLQEKQTTRAANWASRNHLRDGILRWKFQQPRSRLSVALQRTCQPLVEEHGLPLVG